MSFEPIAIVGRGALLPDALDPDAFWDNISAGRVSLTAASTLQAPPASARRALAEALSEYSSIRVMLASR